MGSVNAKIHGPEAANEKRFHIKEMTVHGEDDGELGAPILRVEFDKKTGTTQVSRSDGYPVEYVDIQDGMMLKMPGYNFALRFKLQALVTPTNPISNVTFVTGSTRREVDSFVATEMVQNANIQNEDNVTLVGDFNATTSAPDIINSTFVYPVNAQQASPVHFVFCEYNKSSHSLKPLMRGSFYIPPSPMPAGALSPDARPFSPLRDYAASPLREITSPLPGSSYSNTPMTTPVASSTISAVSSAPQAPLATSVRDTMRVLGPQPQHHEQFEDSPLFRSKVSAMERRTAGLKQQVKIILKRAIVLHDQLKESADSIKWFTNSISTASRHDIPALRLILPMLSDHTHGMGGARNLLLTVCAEFSALVIAPLRNLYEFDIKPLDIRKKEFEDESSQYYSWMSRYLSTKRDRKDKTIKNDAQYLERRLMFETSRFDYYNALVDVHGGKKLQQLTYQLALFSQRWTELMNGASGSSDQSGRVALEQLVEELRQSIKDWARFDQEREDRRRQLERFSDPNTTFTLQDQDDTELDKLEAVQDEAATHKEGLLWALSRPGGITEAQNLSKQGIKWHKYWVVQDGGKLWEYANWKQGLDLHNEPIDLKVARVHEANPADRRFCFEIITPNYKRVYQATNDEDLKSWITYIKRGISSSLENFSSSSPQSDIIVVKPRDTIEKLGENIGRKLSLKTSRRGHNSAPPVASSPIDRTMYGSPVSSSMPPPPTIPKAALALVSSLQKIPSNRQCAECESTRNVEWVSINLLVLLCISCSGAHRSLGSHITKVRSLTLDTVSFTKDLVECLKEVSNAKVNGVWESRLAQKPLISDRNRLQFISEKYVEKAYIREIEKPNAALRRAIADQDVLKVCQALAARANPNAASDDGEPLLIYSLRGIPSDPPIFKISELLLVNGATIPAEIPTDLSEAAQRFLEQRSKN